MKLTPDSIISGLLGVAVGDALGVPVEFVSRNRLAFEPVTEMKGYGTHDQPPGTWSDDSSLTFCLAESLCYGYNPVDVAKKMEQWFFEAYWTAHGEVFDIGISTQESLTRLKEGIPFDKSGAKGERSNGNGSLMRILPLAYYFFAHSTPAPERLAKSIEISAITHAHIRSGIACFIYTDFALQLLAGKNKHEAYEYIRNQTLISLRENGISETQINPFSGILFDNIAQRPENEIESSGYVVHTLEASLWALLNYSNYQDIVLTAVNLGSDTDTTAAVVGGLAGIVYGHHQIPPSWIQQIARKDEIISLAQRLFSSLYSE